MKQVDLRALRAERKRTLKQQAELAGVSISTISRMESGKQLPHLKNLWAIAKAYEVSALDVVASVIALNANSTAVHVSGNPPEVCISSNVAQNVSQIRVNCADLSAEAGAGEADLCPGQSSVARFCAIAPS